MRPVLPATAPASAQCGRRGTSATKRARTRDEHTACTRRCRAGSRAPRVRRSGTDVASGRRAQARRGRELSSPRERRMANEGRPPAETDRRDHGRPAAVFLALGGRGDVHRTDDLPDNSHCSAARPTLRRIERDAQHRREHDAARSSAYSPDVILVLPVAVVLGDVAVVRLVRRMATPIDAATRRLGSLWRISDDREDDLPGFMSDILPPVHQLAVGRKTSSPARVEVARCASRSAISKLVSFSLCRPRLGVRKALWAQHS